MNNCRRIVLCALIMLELLPLASAIGRPSTISLENNGYKNMVIAIDESVEEDSSIITGIQSTMTKASKYLYNATRQRAFFQEITILVPNSWTPASTHAQHTTESITLADVVMVNSTSRTRRALPQTRMYTGCGSQGVHVLLTHEFVTQPTSAPYFHFPEKYFVHSFATFRWGVFQEYGEIGESQFYVSLASGKPEAIRCVYYMRGLIQKTDVNRTICYTEIDPNTGVYTPDCFWRPYPYNQRVQASFMDHQYIREIVTFCDDTSNYMLTHNYEAPSKHNRLCDHRSTWDIITNTPDFSNGANPTRPGLSDQELTPSFKVVRAAARRKRAVVIVDPSVKENEAQDAYIAKTVNQMKHELSKHSVDVSILHSGDTSSTNRQFPADTHVVRVLHANSTTARSDIDTSPTTNVLLISEPSDIPSTNDDITYVSNPRAASDVFSEHLRHVIITELDIAGEILTLHRRVLQIVSDGENGSVALDSALQKTAFFRFHYTAEVPTVELLSPSGNTYGIDSAICYVDPKHRMMEFTITDQFEVGTWKYFILLSDTMQQDVYVIVTSLPDKQHDEHMQIKSSAKLHVKPYSHITLYVDVLCHMDPVVGLDVRAKVVVPDGTIAEVQLLDNGAGADTSRYDGVYSRFYTNMTMNGVYHVTYVVYGDRGQFYVKEDKIDILSADEEDLSIETSFFKRKIGSEVHRHVTGNSVLHHAVADVIDDVIPPSRIQDLKVSRYLQYKRSFVLHWTAPGDDLDTGKVFKYRLWIGRDVPDVRILKHIQKSGRKPFSGHVTMESVKGRHEGGKTEVLVWPVKYMAKTYAFGIQAVDDIGNVGEMSNIATGSFAFS